MPVVFRYDLMSRRRSLLIPPSTSSIADMSSILYEGRASVSEIADILAMAKTWKDRLAKLITDQGKSQRGVSLAAGMGAGYLHSIFKEGKEPTIDHLMRICEAAEVSIYQVLTGFEITPEDEEFLRLLVEADASVRDAVLLILRRDARPSRSPAPPVVQKNQPAAKRVKSAR